MPADVDRCNARRDVLRLDGANGHQQGRLLSVVVAAGLGKERRLIALLLAPFTGPVALLAAVLALVHLGGNPGRIAGGSASARATVVTAAWTSRRLAAVAARTRALAREAVLVARQPLLGEK